MNGDAKPEPAGVVGLLVDRPVAMVMVTIALLVVGVIALLRLPLAFMPDTFASSRIEIFVPLGQNRSPTEAEEKIARPLEEQIRTIPGVKRIRSFSERGNVRCTVELEPTLDPVLASAEVRDRIQRARLEWPGDVDRYFTWREDSSSMPLVFFQILTPEHSPHWDALIDEVVRPRLEAVDGVGRVDLWGLLLDTVRIWFDRDKLVGHRVDFRRLVEQLAADNFAEPVGEVDNGQERLLLRVDSKFRTLADIERWPVRPGLGLGDIARVERVPAVRDRLSRFEQKYTYSGSIRATAGANPVDASRRVRAAAEALRDDPRLADVDVRFLFDQGAFIEESLSTLRGTALQGGALAVLVLLLFLRNLRFTIAISFAIPLTLLIVAAQLYFSGGSLNILSMAGMTLAIGMVVDNSVVVLENVRRLRDAGVDLRTACIRGAREVGFAVTTATLTTVVVFAPLIFMSSNPQSRAMTAAVGIPLSVALLGSLVVALVLLPAGIRHVGRSAAASAGAAAPVEPPRDSRLTRLNQAMLGIVLRRRRRFVLALLVAGTAAAVLGAPLYPRLDFESGDRNPFRSRDVTINLDIPRGMTLLDVQDAVIGYEQFLLARKAEWHIDSISVRFSRTDARFDIDLVDGLSRERYPEIAAAIRRDWPQRAGVHVVLTSATDGGMAAEQDQRNFVLRLWGRDSEYLGRLALRVAQALEELPEVEQIEKRTLVGREEVVVDIDRDRVEELGVRPESLFGTMASGLQGRELTRFEESGREVRLIAQFDSGEVNPSLVDLKETRVWSQGGAFQPVSALADVRFERALSGIARLDGRTSVTIVGRRAAEVGPRELADAMARVMRRFPLPRGYSWSEDSPSRETEMQIRELVEAMLLAITLVFLLMGMLFESLILPASILVTIPIALWGAMWSLKLFHGSIDPMAVVGMILLCGVVVNNGIVLLDCIERLRRDGIARNTAILEGARQRMRPIVMTASTTIVGLLPMALFGESTGQGISYVSMSVAVAGGLGLCTLFTAFAVPIAYTFMDDLSGFLAGMLRRSQGPVRS